MTDTQLILEVKSLLERHRSALEKQLRLVKDNLESVGVALDKATPRQDTRDKAGFLKPPKPPFRITKTAEASAWEVWDDIRESDFTVREVRDLGSKLQNRKRTLGAYFMVIRSW